MLQREAVGKNQELRLEFHAKGRDPDEMKIQIFFDAGLLGFWATPDQIKSVIKELSQCLAVIGSNHDYNGAVHIYGTKE